MNRSPSKSLADMTSVEHLTYALLLALNAPSDACVSEAGDIDDWLARDLSDAQVECCKAVALAQWKAGAT